MLMDIKAAENEKKEITKQVESKKSAFNKLKEQFKQVDEEIDKQKVAIEEKS